MSSFPGDSPYNIDQAPLLYMALLAHKKIMWVMDDRRGYRPMR